MKTCCLGKTVLTLVQEKTASKASKPLEISFSDVVGPIMSTNLKGFCFLVTFINESSSHLCVKIKRTKYHVYQKLKEYLVNYSTPSLLDSDKGTKYTDNKLKKIVATTKSKKNIQFLKLLKKLVSLSDKTEL